MTPPNESSRVTKAEMDLAHHWIEVITTGKGRGESWLGTELPFSFRVGNLDVRALWPKRKRTWVDDQSGLRVTWQLRRLPGYPAVEWILWFENAGKQPVQIEDIQSLALRLSHSVAGQTFVLHGLNGGRAGADDMLPLRLELRGAEVESVVLGSDPWPSNKHLPFFNVEVPGNRGVLVGIGAPRGWWEARFHERDSQLDVVVRDQNLTIAPGQNVRGQRILLVFWEGARLHGHNMLRQVLYKHYVPKLHGQPQLPLVSVNACFTHHGRGGFLVAAEENNLLPLVEPLAKLGAEMFVVDAGWVSDQRTEDSKGWFPANGAWQVSRTKYPNGFRPLADRLAAAGIGLGVWFATPEDPAFLGQVDEIVRQGMTLFRHDMNANSPKRLEFWDAIRAKYPDLIMEGCCGGGRNIDLETIARFHWHQKSDRWGQSEEDQCGLYGANHYLPGGTLIVYTPSQQGDDYHVFTGFAGLLSLEMHPLDKDFPLENVRRQVQRYKRIRHLLSGDFYPLTTECTTTAPWIGYQFHRADLNRGVAFLFRRQNGAADYRASLRGLTASSRYAVRSESTGELKTMTGRALADGIAISLPSAPGAEMITYEPAGNPPPNKIVVAPACVAPQPLPGRSKRRPPRNRT